MMTQLKRLALSAALLASITPAAFAADSSSSSNNSSLPGMQMFSGDKKLACEAILCLSTGQRPNECTPPIRRYFEIKDKHWEDTLRDRGNFLRLCPSASQNPQMASLVDAIVNGAGRCDAASLNIEDRYYANDDSGNALISDQMPSYCTAYINNPLTNLNDSLPRYVGDPQNGGFWSDPATYAANLKQYEQRQEEIKNAFNNN